MPSSSLDVAKHTGNRRSEADSVPRTTASANERMHRAGGGANSYPIHLKTGTCSLSHTSLWTADGRRSEGLAMDINDMT